MTLAALAFVDRRSGKSGSVSKVRLILSSCVLAWMYLHGGAVDSVGDLMASNGVTALPHFALFKNGKVRLHFVQASV
jgi:hypothetical protein